MSVIDKNTFYNSGSHIINRGPIHSNASRDNQPYNYIIDDSWQPEIKIRTVYLTNQGLLGLSKTIYSSESVSHQYVLYNADGTSISREPYTYIIHSAYDIDGNKLITTYPFLFKVDQYTTLVGIGGIGSFDVHSIKLIGIKLDSSIMPLFGYSPACITNSMNICYSDYTKLLQMPQGTNYKIHAVITEDLRYISLSNDYSFNIFYDSQSDNMKIGILRNVVNAPELTDLLNVSFIYST